MSKQSEAKKQQGYQDKPMARRCRECTKLKSTESKTDWGYITEKLSCKIGNFAVKANSICNEFEAKVNNKK